MKNKQTKHQQFYISKHLFAWIVLGCVLLFCVSFFAGYFLGKQSMVSLFVSSIEQNSLADHVCASLYSRCDEHNKQKEPKACSSVAIESEGMTTPKCSNAIEPKLEAISSEHKKEAEQVVENDLVEVDSYWYAQLIGFKTRRAADQFIEKLSKRGITVQLKTRYSKNARGKRIVWYQAVTPKYNDRTQLDDMLQKIKKTERINGIRVITC